MRGEPEGLLEIFAEDADGFLEPPRPFFPEFFRVVVIMDFQNQGEDFAAATPGSTQKETLCCRTRATMSVAVRWIPLDAHYACAWRIAVKSLYDF